MLSIKERKELHAMTYMDINKEWVKDQLDRSHSTGTIVGNIVEHLLNAIEDAEIKRTHSEHLDKALLYAAKLAKGHPIVVETDTDSWVDLHGGDLSVRDTVRVKPSAYDGQFGIDHNGRRGRVTAMRNGKITVLYDGDPVELAKSHEIHVLQKLDVK